VMRGLRVLEEIRTACFDVLGSTKLSQWQSAGMEGWQKSRGINGRWPGGGNYSDEAAGCWAGESGARMLGGSLDTLRRSWQATSMVVIR
jgi:hypothetical protein